MDHCKNLVVEIFYGGSHKQLLDILFEGLQLHDKVYLVTLPAKKWHWKARTGALTVADLIPREHNFKVLFSSSVLNLAELLALRPDLHHLRKIVYFHENQLIYPVQQQKERDFQYGYNQILTCLVADEIIFNSEFNKSSFLSGINKFMKIQPGPDRPKGLPEKISPKCRVLYFPIDVDNILHTHQTAMKGECPLHIVWPHRWEHDKNPEMFIRVLLKLKSQGLQFRALMLGKMCSDVPEMLAESKNELGDSILRWGYVESREDYISDLCLSDVVVSTAKHEFFGVAMIEAVLCGCYPLCPDGLVYPELYPKQCLYKSEDQLFQILSELCKNPSMAKERYANVNIDHQKYNSRALLPEFGKLFDLK